MGGGQLEEEVALAAGLEAGRVEVTALKAGSVLAFMRLDARGDPEGRTAAQVVHELKQQAQQAGSALLSGKLCSRCVQIRLLDSARDWRSGGGKSEAGEVGELRAELAAALEDKEELKQRAAALQHLLLAHQVLPLPPSRRLAASPLAPSARGALWHAALGQR